MYDLKTFIIACVVCLAVGAIGTSAGFIIVGNADNRRLDSDLRASRADFAALSEQYSAITKSNSDLAIRLEYVHSGIEEAAGLTGQLYVTGESLTGQIRRVIENLRKIKIILDDIEKF